MDPYRVAFWLRDLEQGTEDDVWSLPAVVNSATPYISEWYKNGGNNTALAACNSLPH